MKPYRSKPVLKERLWGGQKLKDYNKAVATNNIGESWETDKDTMPVLIKLIDANDILSVQVHPNDGMALELENQQHGKTEAWIVLECDEGAELVAGIKQGANRGRFEEAIYHGGIEQLLHTVKVKKGDCIYIPAGTVHSIGKGMVVYEVQQPSDLTYRLYDWNRRDEKGIPRELHIEKALKCINFDESEISIKNLYELTPRTQEKYAVFQTPYFNTSYLRLENTQEYRIQSSCFTALTLIYGEGYICFEGVKELAAKGDTWVIPADCEVNLCPVGAAEFVMSESCAATK